MSKLGWRLLVAGLGLAVLGALPTAARAQGVTTGGVAGTVTDENGAPVEAAQIQIINRRTGFRSGALSRDNGRYVVLGLETGGPYSVVVRRIGYEQFERNDVYVPLSQTALVDARLARTTVTLAGVRVTADANAAIINPTRTGVGTTVSDSALRRLPTLNRNFTDIVLATPQVSVTDASGTNTSPRISAVGVNNRYNSIQIDGAAESDLFGLGATGQPGGQGRGKSISIESVKEYQVLLTPYDVRQGNFAGALINAVTKSGTNAFSGNAYWVNRNETLTRDRPFINTYDQSQYGFTLGGPIIKDRVHFFINPEFQKRSEPAPGPFVGGTGAAATYVDTTVINRFANILQEEYGIDAGNGGFQSNDNPLTNIFARLDVQLPWSSRLVLRHNYGKAEIDQFTRDLPTGGTPTFNLTSQGYLFTSDKNSTVAQLFTNWRNGANNELFVGYTTVRDNRDTPADVPSIIVNIPRAGGAGTARLRAGTENASHRNVLEQDILELTDNFTFPLGSHRLTLGTRNEFYKVANLFGQRLFGEWTVNFTCPTSNPTCNLDSLAAGAATNYQAGIPFANDPNEGTARFKAATFGFYAQDQWAMTERLTVTAGIRAEIPTFDDAPPLNPVVATAFNRNTDDVPTGNIQWAPRVGFNWDATGDGRNQVRGGGGVFVGRPAFVWLGNAFQNSGLTGIGQITCSTAAAGIPRLTTTTTQPSGTPQNCTNSTTAPRPDINLLDPDLKFPQFARWSLGWDHRIGEAWITTLEGIYNDAMYNFFFDNIAKEPSGIRPTAPEYRGRVFYGNSVSATGIVTPNDIAGFRNIIDVRNKSKDYSFALTAGIQRKYVGRLEGGMFYTYTQARDVQSYSSSVATSNWRQGRSVAGNLSNARLGRSKFEQPHRIVLSGTYSFPTRTDLSVIYSGNSGQPYDYSYTGNGDMNGDGQVGNDLVYVPRSAYDTSEIRFTGTAQQVVEQQAALERYIQNEPCLSGQRGRIMSRNTCRSPWHNTVNVSARQSIPTIEGHNLIVQLDVFNFGNLLNRSWGRAPFINNAGSSSLFLLNQTSATAAINGTNLIGRPIFSFDQALKRYDRNNIESNYQMQLTLRYSF